MKVSPCKDCIEHIFGCRSGCSKYAEYEEAHREEKRIIFKNKSEDLAFHGWKKATQKRILKGQVKRNK